MKEEDHVRKQQCYVSTLSESLPKPTNTRIPIELIKKQPDHWQAHLQHISDFLLEGEGVWWHKEDDFIEFHDITEIPEAEIHGPELHHFRSSSIKEEEKYLKLCWENCINLNITVPIHVIKINLPNGKVKKQITGFFSNEDVPPTCEIQEKTVQEITGLRAEDVEDEEDDDEIVIQIRPTLDETFSISDDLISPPQIVPELSTSLTPGPAGDDITHLTDHTDRADKHQFDMQGIDNPDQAVLERPKWKEDHHGSEYVLKSQLGKAIGVVLGRTNEVEMFDKLHCELKSNKKRNAKLSQNNLNNYQNALAHLQTRVLAENTKTQQLLTEWVKEQFIGNNLQSPSYDEMKIDETAGPLLKKLKYSKGLLSEWKINFS